MPRTAHITAILVLTFLLGAVPPASADREILLYDGTEIKQISIDTDDDKEPRINDSGSVVWTSDDPSVYAVDSEIYLYNGHFSTRLTWDHDRLDQLPAIGPDGVLAWQSGQFTYEGGQIELLGISILMYDGGTTTQISGSELAMEPIITDSGRIVWGGITDDGNQIYVYDGGTVTEMFEPGSFMAYSAYSASSYGVAAGGILHPSGYVPSQSEIFVYDGTDLVQLTDNDYLDHLPSINNAGQVAWLGNPDGQDAEVYLFDGETVVRLTDNDLEEKWPKINEAGQVVWKTAIEPGQDGEIYLYDGSTVVQLTDNDYEDYAPKINDSGHVVWCGEVDGLDSEIFLYDGVSVIQLTDDGQSDSSPQINAAGQITWVGWPLEDPPPLEIWGPASTLGSRETRRASVTAAWAVLVALPLLVAALLWRVNRRNTRTR